MTDEPDGRSARDHVHARLLERFPDLPPGLVVATVGLVRRGRRRPGAPVPSWPQVEAAAEERLLLHTAMRASRPPRP